MLDLRGNRGGALCSKSYTGARGWGVGDKRRKP
ncbi:MAG: hypothetical protein IE917_12570 [Betaproteobacteria bacterium]|nr:hypothetical protein [Betaproteobacteria bacterium]